MHVCILSLSLKTCREENKAFAAQTGGKKGNGDLFFHNISRLVTSRPGNASGCGAVTYVVRVVTAALHRKPPSLLYS